MVMNTDLYRTHLLRIFPRAFVVSLFFSAFALMGLTAKAQAQMMSAYPELEKALGIEQEEPEDCSCKEFRLYCIPRDQLRQDVEGVAQNDRGPNMPGCFVMLPEDICVALELHPGVHDSDDGPDCDSYLPDDIERYRKCLVWEHERSHATDPACDNIPACLEARAIAINTEGFEKAILSFCEDNPNSFNCTFSCGALISYYRYQRSSECNCKQIREQGGEYDRTYESRCVMQCLDLGPVVPDRIEELCGFDFTFHDETDLRECESIVSLNGPQPLPVPIAEEY